MISIIDIYESNVILIYLSFVKTFIKNFVARNLYGSSYKIGLTYVFHPTFNYLSGGWVVIWFLH